MILGDSTAQKLISNGLGVLKIQLEPTRVVQLPFIADLKGALINTENCNHDNYYPYTIHSGDHLFSRTFALDSLNVDITDYLGIRHFPVWIIEQRNLFIEGDRVVIQTTDHRLFAGKSKLLSSTSLILRNHEDVNCEVLDFSSIHFIGRFARGISM
ncbi:hypothetical protein ACFP7A_01450 [Sporolactobacillus kofuensis]|uniref:Peptidase S24/S26A/S26B/S26C domain-containing protein n=1 Tax=Sporolactobacillus kofuensis TaxID=269672 RepID=A0ABW1WA55_9BACL|nr:hypothetical protein [Sporolactobacillus kofuensis]MCO7175999.1 hypothetical protein [Sporolactobacillus kofuensis]